MSDTRNTNDDKGTRFCVTVNTHDDDPEGVDLQVSIDAIERLYNRGDVTYAIGSWERGEDNNRLHLQCWILLKRQSRIGWFTSQVPRSYAEVQKARDDDKACKYACNPEKEGWIGKAFEFGKRPTKGSGRRTDLDTIDTAIKGGEVLTYRQVNDMSPSVAARHPNWVNWRLEEAARDELMTRPRYADVYKPKVWQYWLWRYLTELPPDERKIIFVVDKIGHAGKSRFCREFKRASPKRVQSLRPGRAADMADSLEIRTDVIFIDVPRSRNDYIGHVYSFMEEAKDGEVFSPKFHSRYKPLPACHIVMFTNSDVDTGGARGYVPASRTNPEIDLGSRDSPLSHDRYAIWELHPSHLDVWDESHARWGQTCPPFQSFDSEMSVVPYHPPFVATHGPQFNGDNAGDGPPRYPMMNHTDFTEDVEMFDSQDTVVHRTLDLHNHMVPVLTLLNTHSTTIDEPEGSVWESVWDVGYPDFVRGAHYTRSRFEPLQSEFRDYISDYNEAATWYDNLDLADLWDGDVADALITHTFTLGRTSTAHLGLGAWEDLPDDVRAMYQQSNPNELTLLVNYIRPEGDMYSPPVARFEVPDFPKHAPAA